jgi:hypothetical protein
VTPISLGIFASANTTVGTSFESIAVSTVGSGGSSSISFTSIPSTYKHLQIRILGKATASAYLRARLNSATSGYANHIVYGTGASALAAADSNNSYINLYSAMANTTTSVFSGVIIDILDYTDTNKNTTLRSLNGIDYNGSGEVGLNSGLWNNTSAVTEISFDLNTGNFAQYSHFALYGIKGA